MIRNPIFPGFNSDPCICRKGDDYYAAVSTFEWLPGIPIYHSKDLKHWELLTHVFTADNPIDLRRLPSAKGLWAPCLTYCEEEDEFYVVYGVMNSMNARYFDVNNYVIHSKDICGPWSEPVYLHSAGFDASMLHDDDGRKYVVALMWETRKGYEKPGYIGIAEYDPKEEKIIGYPVDIWHGATVRGCMEGPHLTKRNGWYYLMCAEGGTGYYHCVTMGRSRSPWGPYEPDPQGPILTSQPKEADERADVDHLKPRYYNPDVLLQKAGHGSYVDCPDGETYMMYHCSRPFVPELRCTLGRESAIRKMVWTDDGWLRTADGSILPKEFEEEPAFAATASASTSAAGTDTAASTATAGTDNAATSTDTATASTDTAASTSATSIGTDIAATGTDIAAISTSATSIGTDIAATGTDIATAGTNTATASATTVANAAAASSISKDNCTSAGTDITAAAGADFGGVTNLPERDDFDGDKLGNFYYAPRILPETFADLKARPGWVRLRGQESRASSHEVSILARKLTALNATITTKMDFQPEHFKHSAGLILYYDNMNYLNLRKYYSETLSQSVLAVTQLENGVKTEFLDTRMPAGDLPVWLRLEIRGRDCWFEYSRDGETYRRIGQNFDTSKFSDEYSQYGEFTGTFFGITCADELMHRHYADFDFLDYIIHE